MAWDQLKASDLLAQYGGEFFVIDASGVAYVQACGRLVPTDFAFDQVPTSASLDALDAAMAATVASDLAVSAGDLEGVASVTL